MSRTFACLLATLLATAAARAADLGRNAPPPGQDPYSPVAPIGFASEFPRSPLEDIFVNGEQRFLSPEAAQAHCPHDRVVAVGFLINRYERPAPDQRALYICRAEAAAEGERPATGR